MTNKCYTYETTYITPQILESIADLFPSAYAHLHAAQLAEEYRQLSKELTWNKDARRRQWIVERLETMELWLGYQPQR